VLDYIQGGSNMTGTNAACLHTNQSRSYLNHLVFRSLYTYIAYFECWRRRLCMSSY